MNDPFFSIIVPVYNVEKYIYECLESLYRQDIEIKLYEVIVINDGTPDASMTIVNDVKDNYANLIVIDKKNGGVSSARNAGLNIAKGKYILFVDADDIVAENTLSNMLEMITKNPADKIIFNSLVLTQKNQYFYPFPEQKSEKKYTGTELFQFYHRGSVCGLAFDRSFLSDNNLRFDEELINSEDALFFSYALLYAMSIYHYNLDFYFVRIRHESASRSWDFAGILKMNTTIRQIKTFKEQSSLNPQQRAILNFRLYLTIANMIYQFIKLFQFSKLGDLKQTIREADVLPIFIEDIPKDKWKIIILNKSLNLFFLLYFLRVFFSFFVKFSNEFLKAIFYYSKSEY